MNYHLYPTPKGIGAYPGAKPEKTDESGSLIVPLLRIWKDSLIAYMVEPEFKAGDVVYREKWTKQGKIWEVRKAHGKYPHNIGIDFGDWSGFVNDYDLAHYPPGHQIPSSECVFVEKVKIYDPNFKINKVIKEFKWQPAPEPEKTGVFVKNLKKYQEAHTAFRSKCLSGEIRIKETKK